MWLFLIALFTLSIGLSIVNIALWRRKRAILLYLASLAVGLYALTPAAARFSLPRLTATLSRFDVFSAICALQIAEATAALFLTPRLIEARFAAPHARRARLPAWRRILADRLALLPGAVFMLGAWCGQVLVFNRIHGRAFHALAAQYALAFFGLTALATFTLRFLLHHGDEAVLHLRVGLVFLLLVVAMIAPLIVIELQLLPAAPGGDPRHALATLAVLAAIAGAGFFAPRRIIRRRTA